MPSNIGLTMRFVVLLFATAMSSKVLATNAQTTGFAAELRAIPEKQCVEPTYTSTPLSQEIIGTVQLKVALDSDGKVKHVYAVPNGKYMLEQLTQRQLGGCTFPQLTLAGRTYPGEITISVPWTIPGVSDPKVELTNHCRPEYPSDAKRRGAEGTTDLEIQVSELGEIVDVKLARSSSHEDLDRAAIASVKRCKAIPGTSAGQPKQKRALVKFVWRME